MDPELRRHFEDIFQLLDDIASCMTDMNATSSPANVIEFKLRDIKTHIREASEFLTAKAL